MTREIKFRIWDKENKEMYYTVNTIKNNSIMEMLINFDSLGASVFVSGYGREDTKEVKEFELMKDTGLKDKKGTEIYGGDVLKQSAYFKHEDDRSYLVVEKCKRTSNLVVVSYYYKKYEGKEIKLSTELPLIRATDYIVVGNVHDNPELLESEVEKWESQ